MHELDDTDLEILELLLEDARRPYSDIAEAVDLSPPAVSERVTRLQEAGVIQRFTLDLDRSQLRAGVPVLVDLATSPGTDTGEARETLLAAEAVEHVFTTAAGDLVVYARVPDSDVADWLTTTLDPGAVEAFDVTLLAGADWAPEFGGTEFALTCAECGNTVDSEGETARIDGDRYHFCCPSCRSQFEERYRRHAEQA